MFQAYKTMTKVELIGVGVLLILLVASALAVIYCKNYSRSLFSEIEQQEKTLDQYEVVWGQMQLEASTLTEQNRVEAIATKRLKLGMPARDKIIYVKP